MNEIQIVVLGKSGSGKTTVMLHIAEMLKGLGKEVSIESNMETLESMVYRDSLNDRNVVLNKIDKISIIERELKK